MSDFYRCEDENTMINSIILQDMDDIYSRGIPWSKLENKTLLLTGAYGMLASYITYMVAYLNVYHNMHIKLIAVVRSEIKFRKQFGETFCEEFPLRIVESTMTEPLLINEPVDYIVHAASLASPQYYATMPVEVIEPNTLGTYYLLQLAREKKTEGFLLFSTGDVYGKVDDPTNIKETTVGNLDPLDVHSCYGESKRLAETMCEAFWREYSVPVKIARIFHTYGPTMNIHSDPRVFASFLKCALERHDIIIQSDGTARRPFCYLADAAAAYFLLLLIGVPGEAYNVANTQEFLSISELAQIVAKLQPEFGLKVQYRVRNKGDSYVENRLNKDNCPREDKLRQLGWKTKFSTREGMMRCLNYFLAGDVEN